ncbi:MAG: S8 family peptidase [Halobacteriota archaeon]|nr:S8 family peptidase [Halobacteriota archaeon]
MAGRYEHLTLPFVPEDFLRKKRRGWSEYKKVERSKNEFYKTEIQKFNGIQQKHRAEKNRFKEYLDPNLIFKIEINQNVSEEAFKTELKRMDTEVISPSPDKKGYWVVFAEDEEFEKFQSKLKDYAGDIEDKKYSFFNAIDGISDIPSEEKIGEYLQKEPFEEDEYSSLDIEIWRMDDDRLNEFLKGFKRLISGKNGETVDGFVTENFCLMKVKVGKQLYEDILSLREIAHVDRPPKIKLETPLDIDIEELNIGSKPPEDATGILVVDSGILSSHPLLENAVGDEIAVGTRYSTNVSEDRPYDDVGHGTQVAGLALYGDIDECIRNRNFDPEAWIFSAKVMFKDEYGYATYDEDELLEHQLDEAVRRIVKEYSKCKIINLSIGDSAKRMYEGKRQFNLAALVDELSKELNVIFVVSAGNYEYQIQDEYPNFLLDDSTDRVKIIDPATSALALTVGALSKNAIDEALLEDLVGYPSLITRVGPGYKGMIKPELVENGGDGFDREFDVITINPHWIEDGCLFTKDCGTSFSAPNVSNYIARLMNKFPDRSPNLIKALLIYSASIPEKRPAILSEIGINDSDKKAMNLLKVYGFGKPNFDKCIFSEDNRVVLLRENTIKPNNIHVYPVYLSKEFIEEKGNRQISVTLVFDPPINKNRVEYLGVAMETHLFKNIPIENVIGKYSSEKIGDKEEIIPEDIKKNEI